MYEAQTGGRLLFFLRSSRQALTLLSQGLVHAAGIHLGTSRHQDGNAAAVKSALPGSSRLLSLVRWDDGVALAPGFSINSWKSLRKQRLRWVGREPGSGARQCLDRILPAGQTVRQLARDHRGVAEAIRCGWADAGVCLKLTSAEAGLSFVSVQQEDYDLCIREESAADPRIQSLIRVIRSKEFRRVYGELPGYDSSHAGDMAVVSTS
jgi:molybdate-binding protein